jgi:uncharacterized protein with PIN domain
MIFMENRPVPHFACDAMLGRLARWLRAAGYDAWWRADVTDQELVRLGQSEGRFLLSCDTDIFQYAVVRDGAVAALRIPNELRRDEQLAFVMGELRLEARTPRCMACGGELAEVPRDQARERVPPRSFAWVEQFFACRECGQMFWHGSHWQRIASALARARNGEAH